MGVNNQSDSPQECRTLAPPGIEDKALTADVQALSALGTDTRYEALRVIDEADGGVCVCELLSALGVSQSTASRALSRLHSAGLLSRTKEGRWRFYSLTSRAEALLATLDETRSDRSI